MNQLNQIIEYLEDHLTENISVKQVAQEFGVNDYHLKRIFSFFFGITINEYLKLRRLTLANQDLLQGKSVTETAFKYGYQSLEGFSRAFKEYTSITPSEIYSTQLQKTFLAFRTEVTIQGGLFMEFKIIEKPSFYLAGVTKRVPIQFVGENNSIIELAQSITQEQKEHMNQLKDLYPNQVINASFQFDDGRLEEKDDLTHLIGVVTSKEKSFSDLQYFQVPSHVWAIFPSWGSFPETLQNTWEKIYSDWLPQSGYQLTKAPEISFIDYSTPVNNRYSEIWIAVNKQ